MEYIENIGFSVEIPSNYTSCEMYIKYREDNNGPSMYFNISEHLSYIRKNS